MAVFVYSRIHATEYQVTTGEQVKIFKFINLRSLILSGTAFLFYISGKLYACPGCAATYSKQKLDAYMLTIYLLIALVFIGFGSIAFFVYYKNKQHKISTDK